MNNEDIRKWCHEEMRAPADSPMHARGRAILALVNAAEAPPWHEALGEAIDAALAALIRERDEALGACAAMREALVENSLGELPEHPCHGGGGNHEPVIDCWSCYKEWGHTWREQVLAYRALAPDAGRILLTELVALRAEIARRDRNRP